MLGQLGIKVAVEEDTVKLIASAAEKLTKVSVNSVIAVIKVEVYFKLSINLTSNP